MEPLLRAKYRYIRIQFILIAFLGSIIFSIRYFSEGDVNTALWTVLLIALEVSVGGLTIWKVFQFYQPRATFSFNPLFILVTLTLMYGLAFYTLSNYNPWISRDQLYNIGWPFHLVGMLCVYWILFYEWWFLKNEIRNDYNLQRLLNLQEDLKNSEIKNIQQNIQPHFLYNSLNSINSLMLIDQDEAQKMVVKLSDFLRYSVLKNQEMFDRIEDELQQLERYFSIEKIRFPSRLFYQLECSEELLPRKMPSMILQPLVDNAIKYGLYGQIDRCDIHIRFTEVNETLYIEVSNNFDGSSEQKAGTGYGLKSLHQKLFWLYGDDNLLKTTRDGNLFKATIRLPQLKNENLNY